MLKVVDTSAFANWWSPLTSSTLFKLVSNVKHARGIIQLFHKSQRPFPGIYTVSKMFTCKSDLTLDQSCKASTQLDKWTRQILLTITTWHQPLRCGSNQFKSRTLKFECRLWTLVAVSEQLRTVAEFYKFLSNIEDWLYIATAFSLWVKIIWIYPNQM